MSSSELVTLRGGLVLPAAVIALALDLEQRGFVLTADGPKLWVSKGATDIPDLTEIDLGSIRQWKTHLLVVVEYDAERAESSAKM